MEFIIDINSFYTFSSYWVRRNIFCLINHCCQQKQSVSSLIVNRYISKCLEVVWLFCVFLWGFFFFFFFWCSLFVVGFWLLLLYFFFCVMCVMCLFFVSLLVFVLCCFSLFVCLLLFVVVFVVVFSSKTIITCLLPYQDPLTTDVIITCQVHEILSNISGA